MQEVEKVSQKDVIEVWSRMKEAEGGVARRGSPKKGRSEERGEKKARQKRVLGKIKQTSEPIITQNENKT